MVAEQPALGPFEGEGGLPGDERREARVRARAAVPAAQVADRGGLARHHRRPVRLAAHDPRLHARGRAAHGVQRHHVRPAHPPAAPALTGQPRHPHRRDGHVVGEARQRLGQGLRVDGEYLARVDVVGAQPFGDEPPLDVTLGIDQHHGPVHPAILAYLGGS